MNNLHIAFDKVNYRDLKQTIERKVEEFKWSNSLMYSLEPFENELKKMPKPKELEVKPKEEYYEFGFDNKERLIMTRIFDDGVFKWEKFYVYHGDVVFSYYFDIRSEELLIIERMFFQNGKIKKTEAYRSVYSNNDWAVKEYKYEKNKLNEIIKKTYYKINEAEYEQVRYEMEYKKDGTLDSIESHWKPMDVEEEYSMMMYKAMDEGCNIEKVIELLSIEIVGDVSIQLANLRTATPVYAAVLDYTFGGSTFVPQTMFIGTEEDREYILEHREDVSNGELWNQGEFVTFVEVLAERKKEIERFESMFDTYVFENEAYPLVENMVDKICEELNKKNIQKMMKVTNDFVLFPHSNDIENFEANFKKYVDEELIREFKEKKWL